MKLLPTADLDLVLDYTADLWPAFAGKRLLITGGTGFVGKWLKQTFDYANEKLKLGAEVVAIGRPIQYPASRWDAFIHAAPIATRDALEFVNECNIKHFMLVSSGAVYEQQTEYACMKRSAEMLTGKRASIARIFCSVGPYLNDRYAIMRFIHNAVQGKPLNVTGNSIRSYLYAADMAVWLWRILFQGEPGTAYDVGGQEIVSLPYVALTVAERFTPESEVVLNITGTQQHYLPHLGNDLMLTQRVSLSDAIDRTIVWQKEESCSQ